MYHPQSPELKEASPHGTQSFPCAFYQTQMSGHGFMVKHHWHKEAEILYFPGGNFRMEINMEAFDIRSDRRGTVQGCLLRTARAGGHACWLRADQ